MPTTIMHKVPRCKMMQNLNSFLVTLKGHLMRKGKMYFQNDTNKWMSNIAFIATAISKNLMLFAPTEYSQKLCNAEHTNHKIRGILS